MSAIASTSQILPGVPVISPSPIKAKGKKKSRSIQKGNLKPNVAVTYTPTGAPNPHSLKVKLKKKL